MLKTISFALAVWCASATLHAQAPPAPPGSSPKAPDDKPAFRFERLYTRVRFENDGSGRREQTLWIKVLDEQAVRQFGEFGLTYQSESEDLALTDVNVQKPDGTVVQTPASRVQDLPATAGQVPIYLDVRRKVASIASLRPGDVIQITGVWTLKKPIAPGQFWFEYSFEDDSVVVDEQLEIDLPEGRQVALKTAAGTPAEAHGGTGTASGGRRTYRWKTSHPEADTTPQPIQPGDDEPPADVRLSSFRSWDEFARWYTPLAFVPPDDAVKAKAAALTAGLTGDAAKLEAIYRYVSTEIRYVSLSFGLGRFAAHAPADVLKTQYGDCKDKAVLLRALLEAAGVRAVPVLVNTSRSVSDDFVSPLEFDHMIAMVPAAQGAGGTWMDATLEVAPLGMLSPITRDRGALALPGGGKAAAVRTPADSPLPALTEIALTGTVNALGVLDGTVTITSRGDDELAARVLVRAMPRTVLGEFAQRVASVNGIPGEISEPSTSDPADTREPFRITFHVRAKGFLDWAAPRSDLQVPLHDNLPYATDEDRKDLRRLHFTSTHASRLRAAIELPPGYEATAPQPLRVSRAGLSYAATYAVAGSRLTVERETRVLVRDVPETAFGEYSAFVLAVDADRKQSFAIRGTATGTPAIPADVTADELYKAGRSAWDARRYEAAAAIYLRTTELAPKKGDAWIALGLAYDQLGKYDEAAAAIQKQIDLDPYNKRAYGDLGAVLKNAGKKEEAIKAYGKQVEINALDGEAFKQLGMLYVGLDRYGEAGTPLEKAAGLLPRDYWAKAYLAAAYLAERQPDKARRTIDEMLQGTPGAHVRGFVSWRLAEAGADLDRADELARGAEKDIIAQLRDVDVKTLTQAKLEYVDRLAWVWDAMGWVAFQRGKVEDAERYTVASWQLLGNADVARHLGLIYEREQRLADAMNYLLIAQALSRTPKSETAAAIKRLAPNGDLTPMLDSAKRMAPAERTFPIASSLTGTASFLAIVDNTRKAIDVRFNTGAEELKPLADAALRSAKYPISFPADAPLRIALGVRVTCVTGTGCRGILEYPSRVKVAPK